MNAMEPISISVFDEETIIIAGEDHQQNSAPCSITKTSSHGFKLVPWLNWSEWEWVRDSLFSESPAKIASALARISTWRSRGCLPVVIDVTASIIEIQQKDHFYRKEPSDDAIRSEQILAMLYCMTIIRLVNCVVEKTRKKTEVSIAEAAGAIGIPRTLIDLRHEGSHRDLPGLPLVRDSAVKALHWLKSYYWEPQTKQIPLYRDGTANIKKEIKSKLHELALCLKVKRAQYDSSFAEGKSGKYLKQLCGRSKFFSLMASQLHLSKSGGSKKRVTKTLKSLLHLHSSFSSEVLAVLLEFLKKALDASILGEPQEDNQLGQDTHNLLDDWKLVTTKFTRKEPKVLPMLLNAVLNMIETMEVTKYETGACISCLGSRAGTGQMEQLCSLFSWLIGQLEALKPLCSKAKTEFSSTGTKTLKAILMEVLRKSLLLLPFGDKQFMDAVLHLARLMGYTYVIEKLNKLSLLSLSGSVGSPENSFRLNPSDLFMQDEFINEASKKLELVKLRPKRSKSGDSRDHGVGSSGRWTVAKSWNQCPIGMLPRGLGSSGCLPVLVCNDDSHKSSDSSKMKQTLELRSVGDTREAGKSKTLDGPSIEQLNRKREADCDAYQLGEPSTKKMRDTVDDSQSDGEDVLLPKDVRGCLMMNGIWKKVGEEELLAIKSGVRILV